MPYSNIEVRRAAWRRYYYSNLDKMRERGRQYYVNNRKSELAKDKADLSKSLRFRYGIDESQYLKLAESQGYKCACCKSPLDMVVRKRVVVDHDHEIDVVRGILCRRCNVVVWVLDHPELLGAGIEYLERFYA